MKKCGCMLILALTLTSCSPNAWAMFYDIMELTGGVLGLTAGVIDWVDGNNSTYSSGSYSTQRSGRSRQTIEREIAEYEKRIGECERYMENTTNPVTQRQYMQTIQNYRKMIQDRYRELQNL